jgi:Bacterial PH domain
MAIDQIRQQIMASIWRAIAQSEVDISTVPQDQQEKLVGKIADQLMVTINDLLETESGMPADDDPASEHNEVILWEGRPFLSPFEYYVLTDDRLKIRHGMLGRNIENYELIRVQDIDFEQGITERIFGIGDVFIHGQDPSNPTVELRNVPDPEAVYETLRKAWLEARKRHGLQFSEFM